ncbi:MAG: enoyl-CoA hydratase/isomerase family protein [Kofleriaceae bacterium]|nr:enoyl-CoA hydratase/isomerase family protein [Kofleriaceae bacterium]
MHALGKPVIAMVNGPALAGGLGLMLACDYVLASEEASYATTEIKIGLWPMMISAELVRNIGRKKALDLMLSGRRVLAPEALAIGLISEMVPATALEASVMRLARELATRSPSALALGLRCFYETQDLAIADALALLEQRFGELLATPDAKEGLAAFMEKRAPQFGGD